MVIMEPERVSIPGNTRMSKACRTCQFITAVVHTSLDTEAVVYLSLCVHHRCLFAERTSSGQRRSRCVCWHGLSWKVSRSTDGPAVQEIRVCFVHRPVDDSLFSEVHYREKTDMYGLCTRHARVSWSAGLFELHDGFLSLIHI